MLPSGGNILDGLGTSSGVSHGLVGSAPYMWKVPGLKEGHTRARGRSCKRTLSKISGLEPGVAYNCVLWKAKTAMQCQDLRLSGSLTFFFLMDSV